MRAVNVTQPFNMVLNPIKIARSCTCYLNQICFAKIDNLKIMLRASRVTLVVVVPTFDLTTAWHLC